VADSVRPDGETVRQILTVQEGFFGFEASMIKSGLRPTRDRLSYSYCFTVGDSEIRVNCFNTAWMSTNPEVQGQLVFPSSAMNTPDGRARLVIAAFHHPYNWLAAESARRFRRFIDASSDVVLTGHEHEAEAYTRQSMDSTATQYVEGGVLQDSEGRLSSFNIVIVDTEEQSYEAIACHWSQERYESDSMGSRGFIRNKRVCKSDFQNNEAFVKILSDVGAPITHPAKHEICLADIYVYPAVVRKDPENKFQAVRVIESSEVLEYVRGSAQLLVCGEELSGKTSLGKTLYSDLLGGGDFVPVLVTGDQFAGIKEKDTRSLIVREFARQYDEASASRFFEVDLAQRVVIVDDWHKVKYNAPGRVAIIRHVRSLCGKVILLTNRLYALEELAETGPLREILAEFEFCDIREFGKRLTGKLIERWHHVGRDYDSDLHDYAYSVALSEQKVTAIIGKGVLPAYPIFLLGLLQAEASPNSAADAAGSYGHILESVITSRFAQVSTRSTEIGSMYTYASRIAYALFRGDKIFLSAREISTLHDEYCERYQLQLSQPRVLAALVRAKMLHKEGDSYRFAYKGSYCYFVARYFAENLRSSEAKLREELDTMTDQLGWEDYTNIVMFFLYLTRDDAVIDRLLSNAACIYREWAPSDLENDVQFLNKLLKEGPRPLHLPSTDIVRNRDEYRAKQDEREAELERQGAAAPDLRVRYEEGISEITKITIALQTLRVMGQVLRNFPGVLTKEPKYRLAEASYSLGLRVIRRLLALAESQLDDLRVAFGQIHLEAHPLATREEIENSADQRLIWLSTAVCYGIIKKISSSIGLEDLELTFDDVRDRLGEKTSVRLVDLAIHFDHFREARLAEVYDLERDARKNLFVYRILQDLVVEFLYLHNTDTQVLQRLGGLFGVRSNDPRFFVNKSVGSQIG
jgi:hypothetical protein